MQTHNLSIVSITCHFLSDNYNFTSELKLSICLVCSEVKKTVPSTPKFQCISRFSHPNPVHKFTLAIALPQSTKLYPISGISIMICFSIDLNEICIFNFTAFSFPRPLKQFRSREHAMAFLF